MAKAARARRAYPTQREEQLRLMTKIARLYHERGIRQPEIARRLHVSQARVSRLLKQAELQGIVRTTVAVPEGVQTALEEELEAAYGLREAVVVESLDSTEAGIVSDLGVAAATYLETTLTGTDVIGISSWSATLLAAVDSMRPLPRTAARRVIQLVGGVGDPAVEAHAARLAERLAELTGATPTFLLAPGVASSAEARGALVADRFVRDAMEAIDEVTLALVGIGALQPSELLLRSGNFFSEEELAALSDRGAVGDVCLRVFDAGGRPVGSPVDERVIGASFGQLRHVDRVVGVAGAERKYDAIRGALMGRWVNVLITDQRTAERLVADRPAEPIAGWDESTG
jgi:DNA-binding transcriptional regulator LsrR (DeoR family)